MENKEKNKIFNRINLIFVFYCFSKNNFLQRNIFFYQNNSFFVFFSSQNNYYNYIGEEDFFTKIAKIKK